MQHRGFVLQALILFLVFFTCKVWADDYLRPTMMLQQIKGCPVPFQNYVPYPDFQLQGARSNMIITSCKKERQTLTSGQHAQTIAKRDTSGINNVKTSAGGRYLITYNDSGWVTINVPKVENNLPSYENVLGPEDNEEAVWYRKKIMLDPAWTNQKYITLNILGANYITDVWLNTNYIGYHEGGYTCFMFNLTDKLVFSSSNVLALRVDNIQRGSSIASNTAMIPYTIADWFNYTGLFRDIYITIQNKIHTVRADIKTRDNSGGIAVNLVLQNYRTKEVDASGTIEIFKADFSGNKIKNAQLDDSVLSGSSVADKNFTVTLSSNEVDCYQADLNISSPAYWLPSDPNLYIARISLYTNSTLVDQYYTQFGLRTLKIIDNRVQANGTTSPFLAGIGRHEDHPTKGVAMSSEDIYNDLKVIKDDLKSSFVRTGHYPNHPLTYKYADRLGLVTYCEIPAAWFNGQRFDQQRNERHIHKQAWREMIYSHYNSPSIWFWGTCNEGSHTSERQNFISDLYADAYDIDGTRFVMQAATAIDIDDVTHAACDIVGVNMYYGVFSGFGPLGDYYQQTRDALQKLHECFPDKPVLVTEYGYWSGKDDSKMKKQKQVFDETFAAFKEVAIRQDNGFINSDGYLIGCNWWNAFNWYTAISTDSKKLQTMGAIHMNRTKFKLVAYALAEQYQRYSESLPDDTSARNLERVIAYPNPWVEGESYYDYMIFKNLTPKAKVKIYDINESLIRELEYNNELGTAVWYLDDYRGKKVPAGVYIYYIVDDDQDLGQSGKIMVIR